MFFFLKMRNGTLFDLFASRVVCSQNFSNGSFLFSFKNKSIDAFSYPFLHSMLKVDVSHLPSSRTAYISPENASPTFELFVNIAPEP